MYGGLELFINIFLSGLLLGVIYCLMALGIGFIYSVMKMINWSMGEFYMIGSYLQYFILLAVLPPEFWWLALLISSLTVFALGMGIEATLIKPIARKSFERRDDYLTITTILLSLFFRALVMNITGPYIFSPPDYLPTTIQILTLPVNGNRFIAFIASGIALAATYTFIYKTWWGLKFRAVAQNSAGAAMVGIRIHKVHTLAFGIGTMLAGFSGAALAPTFLVYPTNGAPVTARGFEIIVIAGLGSLPGITVASLMLGLTESLLSTYLSPAYREAYGFLLLILILLLRPQGLFGERRREV